MTRTITSPSTPRWSRCAATSRASGREGVRISYMALILAAYFKAYQQNPKINRFIMNSKIYQRNHFCVSFVILKTRADGARPTRRA